jgi:hypothetical protein
MLGPKILTYVLVFSIFCSAFAASLPKSILNSGLAKNSPDSNESQDTFKVETWRPSPELEKYFPYYLSGYDDEDRPIVVIEFGKWDVVAWSKRGKAAWENLERHVQRMKYILSTGIWNVRNVSQNAGDSAKPVVTDEMVAIVDFEDFTISQASNPGAVQFLIKWMGILETLQEKVHSVYFVNVNAISGVVIRLLKPTLGKVFERVEVYGTLKQRWMPIIRRNLPEDQIPEKYGGRKGHKPLIFHG